MSVSIAELDNTVRAFYEGKGDVRKQAQQTLTEVINPAPSFSIPGLPGSSPFYEKN
ncbi:hypothetical protein GX48_04177 [Paracoccidioides brasiliensis]|nr:hypothetical protein GX48_04177 [Paracoccidioides brasiliensis]